MKSPLLLVDFHDNGAAKRIRTPDPRITNALLYQLSYCGIFEKGGHSNPCDYPTKGCRPAYSLRAACGAAQRSHVLRGP
jgi:hypothetical protein